ncbi:cell division protein ZapA [Sphingobium sufflavum]|uniref:cell division protein ZapA n=1 Tax=Sphingobium sufflavum TaxID=1129547 RepID=UPI001F173471|nr:cell division protein ZapA [Sphingobium sufflavum]MCE7796979.1 cell division protein ZapA [Sphingobium sufflavum]
MAEVKVTIAGRSYALHCRDGDEPRLHQLSRMIADRVDKVKASSPGLTEVRQFLFAALLLADDLSDAQAEAKRARDEAPAPSVEDIATVQALETLAERLESIGQALAADTPAP